MIVGQDGALSAHRWQDGLELWETAVYWNGEGYPGSDGERVFAVGACGATTALHATTGVQLWHRSGRCTGGGGGTPRIANGRVYVPERTNYSAPATWLALDSFMGGLRGTLALDLTGPALAAGRAFTALPDELQAQDLSTGTLALRARSRSEFRGPPLVVGEVVYVQTAGQVWGVDRASGRVLWRGERSIVPTEAGGPLASGSGVLVVPAIDRLIAFGPGKHAAGVDNPDKTPASSYTFMFKLSSRRQTYPQRVQVELAARGASTLRRVELQESRYPRRRWRTIRRVKLGSYTEFLYVRPSIHTRYRVVDRDTLPRKVSRSRSVRVALPGRARYWIHDARHVRVIANFRAPPALRLSQKRVRSTASAAEPPAPGGSAGCL